MGREDGDDDLKKKSKSITKVKWLSKLGLALYTMCFTFLACKWTQKCVHRLQSTFKPHAGAGWYAM